MGDSGQLGNQEEPHNLNRKGLLSQGSNSIAMKSRVNREVQARFCERLEVRPLRLTRPKNCPARQSRGFGTKYSQGVASANDHACPNCNAEAALSKDLQGTHIC